VLVVDGGVAVTGTVDDVANDVDDIEVDVRLSG
jgi:hypothetical protein